jgi:hypothetical protein
MNVQMFQMSLPVCGDNITDDSREVEEFDRAEVNCNVTYRGNWKPVFACLPQTETLEVNQTTSNTVTYRDTIILTRDIHNKSLFCELKYTKGSQSLPVAATDGYLFHWSSPALNVSCKFFKCDIRFFAKNE